MVQVKARFCSSQKQQPLAAAVAAQRHNWSLYLMAVAATLGMTLASASTAGGSGGVAEQTAPAMEPDRSSLDNFVGNLFPKSNGQKETEQVMNPNEVYYTRALVQAEDGEEPNQESELNSNQLEDLDLPVDYYESSIWSAPADKRSNWAKFSGGWGKRSWNQMQGSWGKRLHDAGGRAVRSWNNLNGGWGKKRAKWNDLKGMWGRKRGDWSKMSSAWGKRGPGTWNKMSSAWGKRAAAGTWNKMSSAWGKRKRSTRTSHWNQLRGMWGKRNDQQQQQQPDILNQRTAADAGSTSTANP